jgi:hypothetical protein
MEGWQAEASGAQRLVEQRACGEAAAAHGPRRHCRACFAEEGWVAEEAHV